MKKFRQRLAAVLTVTLLAGAITVPSFADEAQKKGWKLEDKAWHFYDSDGEMKRNKEKFLPFEGKFYAFDEDGRMFEDELFVAPKSEQVWEDETGKPIPNRYAYPDGHLAVSSWVKLNGEGHMYTSADAKNGGQILWYYFKKGNEETQKAGAMARDEELTLANEKGKTYRFYSDGHMYTQEWYPENPSPQIGDSYYQANGDKAVDKCLLLDGTWYGFDKDGKVDMIFDEDPVGTASPSNAPYRSVDSVEAVGKNGDTTVKAAPGDTVTLKFQVNLATDSNAKKQTFDKKGHDLWGDQTLSGKFTVTDVREDGLCTVKYTPKSIGIEEVSLFVDDVESDPFSVDTSLENLEAAKPEVKADAIDTLIDSLVNNSTADGIAGDITDTLDSIKEIIKTSSEKDKEKLQKDISKLPNYAALDSLYVMKNKVEVKPVDLANVQSVLGSNGNISMVGGALNASENGSVELMVDTTEIPSDLKSTLNKNDKSMALDITIAVDDAAANNLDFPVRITITVPEGFDASKNITVRHYHEGVELEPQDATPVDDADGKYFSFTASQFSSFVFVQSGTDSKPTTPDTPDNGSSSDSDNDSSSSVKASPGEWVLGANGWWYKNSSNSYPINTWSYLAYGNANDWYRFDKDGYMITGWFTDTDGRIYYLNPVSNGFLGAMQTGWQLIDGYWYYFNTESNGYKGMLLVNTVTPDGYHVNELGQRID